MQLGCLKLLLSYSCRQFIFFSGVEKNRLEKLCQIEPQKLNVKADKISVWSFLAPFRKPKTSKIEKLSAKNFFFDFLFLKSIFLRMLVSNLPILL